MTWAAGRNARTSTQSVKLASIRTPPRSSDTDQPHRYSADVRSLVTASSEVGRSFPVSVLSDSRSFTTACAALRVSGRAIPSSEEISCDNPFYAPSSRTFAAAAIVPHKSLSTEVWLLQEADMTSPVHHLPPSHRIVSLGGRCVSRNGTQTCRVAGSPKPIQSPRVNAPGQSPENAPQTLRSAASFRWPLGSFLLPIVKDAILVAQYVTQKIFL